ncbi:MAG: hypothetical protein U9Q82_01580 [Chloroflexota bacterium]|nr:hypothetical protein [Chloroflexota bacterium]
MNLNHPDWIPLPVLVDQVGEVVGKRDGRWLIVIENANDGHLLQELNLPNVWLLVTAHGTSPLQPLGWEKYIFRLSPFDENESVDLLKQRLDGQWDEENTPKKAKELHRLVSGLPMAVAILAAVIRSRGWNFILERLRDRARAVSV